jgi:hypothetical protein
VEQEPPLRRGSILLYGRNILMVDLTVESAKVGDSWDGRRVGRNGEGIETRGFFGFGEAPTADNRTEIECNVIQHYKMDIRTPH